MTGKAEQIVSSKVLSDPSIENDNEKILDVLIETFIPYKTSASQAAYINDLKQGPDEQVSFFEARANIVVRHIKASDVESESIPETVESRDFEWNRNREKFWGGVGIAKNFEGWNQIFKSTKSVTKRLIISIEGTINDVKAFNIAF